jgi:hypothetical protein
MSYDTIQILSTGRQSFFGQTKIMKVAKKCPVSNTEVTTKSALKAVLNKLSLVHNIMAYISTVYCNVTYTWFSRLSLPFT